MLPIRAVFHSFFAVSCRPRKSCRYYLVIFTKMVYNYQLNILNSKVARKQPLPYVNNLNY